MMKSKTYTEMTGGQFRDMNNRIIESATIKKRFSESSIDISEHTIQEIIKELRSKVRRGVISMRSYDIQYYQLMDKLKEIRKKRKEEKQVLNQFETINIPVQEVQGISIVTFIN